MYYGLERNLKLEQQYEDPKRVVELQRDWFDCTRTRNTEHEVVSFAERVRRLSLEEWDEEARAYER